MKFSFQSKFSTLYFLYSNLSFLHDHHWTKFLCMVVKLPEVNFFLQKSASDIFPCSRNIQISKIHATPSPRENTLIIIKLENFKLSRPNLQWEKEYRYFIIVGISVFVGRGQKKIGVYDCKELRCYFFSSKFCIGFFPVFQKGQNFKNYRDTIS